MPKRINVLASRAERCASSIRLLVVLAVVATVPMAAGAQRRGSGNPTPGTPQPPTPNLADRITVTGCLQAVPRSANQPAAEAKEPSDSRFILTNVKRETRVPPGAGTSAAATAAASTTYRLAAIDSALSPFAGARVEISGQIETPEPDAAPKAEAKPPVLRVEFVQKIAPSCS